MSLTSPRAPRAFFASRAQKPSSSSVPALVNAFNEKADAADADSGALLDGGGGGGGVKPGALKPSSGSAAPPATSAGGGGGRPDEGVPELPAAFMCAGPGGGSSSKAARARGGGRGGPRRGGGPPCSVDGELRDGGSGGGGPMGPLPGRGGGGGGCRGRLRATPSSSSTLGATVRVSRCRLAGSTSLNFHCSDLGRRLEDDGVAEVLGCPPLPPSKGVVRLTRPVEPLAARGAMPSSSSPLSFWKLTTLLIAPRAGLGAERGTSAIEFKTLS